MALPNPYSTLNASGPPQLSDLINYLTSTGYISGDAASGQLDRPWTTDADTQRTGQGVVDQYQGLVNQWNTMFGGANPYTNPYPSVASLPVSPYAASLPAEHKGNEGFFNSGVIGPALLAAAGGALGAGIFGGSDLLGGVGNLLGDAGGATDLVSLGLDPLTMGATSTPFTTSPSFSDLTGGVFDGTAGSSGTTISGGGAGGTVGGAAVSDGTMGVNLSSPAPTTDFLGNPLPGNVTNLGNTGGGNTSNLGNLTTAGTDYSSLLNSPAPTTDFLGNPLPGNVTNLGNTGSGTVPGSTGSLTMNPANPGGSGGNPANSGNSLLGNILGTAATTVPSLLATNWAMNQNVDLTPLYNSLGMANPNAARAAAIAPAQQAQATAYGDLYQSGVNRGLGGSPLLATDVNNFLTSSNSQISNLGNNAYQNAVGNYVGAAKAIPIAQSMSLAAKAPILGAGLAGAGTGLSGQTANNLSQQFGTWFNSLFGSQ